jgi:hypothetical protein
MHSCIKTRIGDKRITNTSFIVEQKTKTSDKKRTNNPFTRAEKARTQ